MSHAETISALYDHEQEGALGGRRRHAHDWGADDLFDGSREPRRSGRLDRRDEREVADWFADDERKRVDDWLAGGHSALRRQALHPAHGSGTAGSGAPAGARRTAGARRPADAWGPADLDAWEPAGLDARGPADLGAWESAGLDAGGSAGLDARGPAGLDAWESAGLDAGRSAGLDARGPSGLDAWGPSGLDAGGAAGLDAWGPADLEGWGPTDLDEGIAANAEPFSPVAPTRELDLPLGAPPRRRRTVTVTGHPEAVRRAERAGEIARRRPAPSLEARIGHRPDRVAMYACAMGLMLVLVAILTANA